MYDIHFIGITVQSWLYMRLNLMDLTAQLARASDQISAVVGSNPAQANFVWLLLKYIIYIYI